MALATLRRTAFMALLIMACSSACRLPQTAVVAPPPLSPVPSPTETRVTATATLPPSTSTTQPTFTPSATASPPPSSTPPPTTTPRIITIAAPADQHKRLARGLAAYQPSAEVGGVLLSTSGGQIELVQEETPFVVWQEPIALAVPFTSELQEVGLEKAQAIAAEGHDLIQIMPWSTMPMNMRALRVDGHSIADEAYPLQETWSLRPRAGYEALSQDLLPALQEAAAEPVIHLAAVGDIMLDRSLGAALEKGDLAYPFAEIVTELQAADITAGNLESALGTAGQPANKRYPFRAPPQAAQALALAGFDIVSMANNHAGDYGTEALLQGMELLESQGVAYAGAGANADEAYRPRILEANGLEVAFFSYVDVPVEAISGFDTESWRATTDTPGLAWADPERISADVAAVQDAADLVVVLLHSGFEYQAAPSEPQVTAAKAAIDAGADLVIGHHAHILQGIEFYKQGVIIYGTGNFAFQIDGPPETAVFHIWLGEEGVRQIEISPAIIHLGGKPRPATSWEATPILSRIYHLTDLLNSG